MKEPGTEYALYLLLVALECKHRSERTMRVEPFSMIIATSLSRKTYNRIVFQTFDYTNIPTIADYYIENPITK